MDSDVDPATGLTPIFSLSQGAPNLVPAADVGVAGVDYVNQTISAGLVGSYSIGDTVWRDVNGDGVLDPGDDGHQRRHCATAQPRRAGHRQHGHLAQRSFHLLRGCPPGAIRSSSPICPTACGSPRLASGAIRRWTPTWEPTA